MRNYNRSDLFCYALMIVCLKNQTYAQSKSSHLNSLLQKLEEVHSITKEQQTSLQSIFEKSPSITQGVESITVHPLSKEACLKQLEAKGGITYFDNPAFKLACHNKRFMAPVSQEGPSDVSKATFCMDQFEFPNIPCEYPLVWTKANEADQICKAMGKRLCDADEWEGGCAGKFIPDALKDSMPAPIHELHGKSRKEHNATRPILWAYGPKKNHSLCGTNSGKTPGCDASLKPGGNPYKACGSNTYPSGSFLECHSPFYIYDQHGNAAETMNLPFTKSQAARNGGTGFTELKGSWFVFAKIEAHPDDCRYRAPYWHGTEIVDPHSHGFYHLGFRCCS